MTARPDEPRGGAPDEPDHGSADGGDDGSSDGLDAEPLDRPKAWQDVEVWLDDRPGALADLGEALGAAGVSLEGGGVFAHAGVGVAHFLVADGARAREALVDAGIGPVVVSDVVLLTLDQGTPGQLGQVARRMADAGVDLRVQYSDHDHRLVLVVAPNQRAACLEVAEAWRREGPGAAREA
jgi:hypothetical protein